ncbi:MAG: zinc ribbon domain-containing protein [Oscillospiraceae bacterium]|nr:zinc ribbon domain-containing protein [Oscillospiraceae bacterium]
MAYCGNCGTKLTEGIEVCPGCGSVVPDRKGAYPYTPSMQADWVVRPIYEQEIPHEEGNFAPEDQTSLLNRDDASNYDQTSLLGQSAPNYDQTTLLDKEKGGLNGRGLSLQRPQYAAPVQYQAPVRNAPPQSREQIPDIPREEPKKKNIWKILIPAIAGGLVLVLILVLVLALGGSSRDSELSEQESLLVDQWEFLFALNENDYVERDDVSLTIRPDRTGSLAVGETLEITFNWRYTQSDGESHVFDAENADGEHYTIYLYDSGDLEGSLFFYFDETLTFFFEKETYEPG